jgi:5-methylcytosine-specific restriction enzyme B
MVALDERIVRDLKALQQQLEEDEKYPAKQHLAQCYQTFRDRFGPDRLSHLDGATLLDTMHGRGNKESLLYWLEFKNDDEFPAIFGSIAGGSAH